MNKRDYISTSALYGPHLAHHGIKGQKWGIRRYQNPDGSLTEEGKKRYNDTPLKNDGHRVDNRRAIRTAAIIAGAAVAVGAGAYIVNRYRNTSLDKVLKAGTKIQHMSDKIDWDLSKPFYASYLRKDNAVYAKNDLFGSNWHYKSILESRKGLRIAGKKTVKKVFNEFLRAKTGEALSMKRTNDIYHSFNANMRSPDIRDRAMYSEFFKMLSDRGYDAIHDVNDQFQTKTIAPLIIFGSLGDLSIKSILEI